MNEQLCSWIFKFREVVQRQIWGEVIDLVSSLDTEITGIDFFDVTAKISGNRCPVKIWSIFLYAHAHSVCLDVFISLLMPSISTIRWLEQHCNTLYALVDSLLFTGKFVMPFRSVNNSASLLFHPIVWSVAQCSTVHVTESKQSPRSFLAFSPNGWEFVDEILHACYTFLSTAG